MASWYPAGPLMRKPRLRAARNCAPPAAQSPGPTTAAPWAGSNQHFPSRSPTPQRPLSWVGPGTPPTSRGRVTPKSGNLQIEEGGVLLGAEDVGFARISAWPAPAHVHLDRIPRIEAHDGHDLVDRDPVEGRHRLRRKGPGLEHMPVGV